MSQTVDELRNEIREAVGRYERVESTAFTKESLAAICESVGYAIDQNSFPPKRAMRAGIRSRIGIADAADPEVAGDTFRKSGLEAIAREIRTE